MATYTNDNEAVDNDSRILMEGSGFVLFENLKKIFLERAQISIGDTKPSGSATWNDGAHLWSSPAIEWSGTDDYARDDEASSGSYGWDTKPS